MKKAKDYRDLIYNYIPEGTVTPAHTDDGHFYQIRDKYVRDTLKLDFITYPSVTGKLSVLKDPSIVNFNLNRAMDYIFAKFNEMNESNLMEHLDQAKHAGTLVFKEAGHIGTAIHDYREAYFQDWIKTGNRPADILNYIPKESYDIRAVSGLRALDKFIDETGYEPVFCELLVYSHRWAVAGTLDDLGIMRWAFKGRKGDPECKHNLIYNESKNIGHCTKCEYKYKKSFALMDLKTSNQFKDHYFFQVAMYYDMLKKLVPGLKIDNAFILKVSKENAQYKIEDLESPSQIAAYARSMLRTSEGLEMIKGRRKDNQKNVIVV